MIPALKGWQAEFLHFCLIGDLRRVQDGLKANRFAIVSLTDNKGRSPLWIAASTGHSDVCRLLLDKGARIDLQNSSGQSPLWIAASEGHSDVCQLLVDTGASLDLKDEGDWSPLWIAASKGHSDVCRLLVDKGASIDLQNYRGQSPLWAAANEGHSDACRLLVDKGASLDLQNQYGRSPLWIAASAGHSDVCCLLFDKGASLDLRDHYGLSPLWIAANNGFSEVCRLLVDKGARIDLPNNSGQSPLWTAASEGHSDVCHLLVDKGASLDPDKVNWSPLWIAASKGHSDICRLLVDKGASIDLQNSIGRSPLWIAAIEGHSDACRLLVGKGASLDLQDKNGQSPLWIAAREGHYDICYLLVDKGASLDLQNQSGQSPFWIAASGGHSDICCFFLDEGASLDLQNQYRQSPLWIAASNGHSDVCRLLVDKGAGKDLQDSGGRSPLWAAASGGHSDVCCLLVDEGASLELQDKESRSPLWTAASKGHSDVCCLLVDKGASVDLQNDCGQSPLWAAARGGCIDVCRLLVDKGASLNLQDKSGYSSLFSAVMSTENNFSWEDVVSYLLEHGADPALTDKKGQKCVDVAPSWRRQPLELLLAQNDLLRYGAKPPESVPVSVIGSPRRGKTTFIKTVIEKMKRKCSTESPENADAQSNADRFTPPPVESPEDLAERTAGVEMKTIELPTGEKFRASDFAGHLDFLMSHHHFLANEHGFYLTFADARKTVDGMLEEALYWIRFILATRPVRYGLPHIVVAFSHCDACTNDVSDRARRVLHSLCTEFEGLVMFSQEERLFLLDCRVWNKEMECLVEELRKQHELLRKKMPLEPRVVADVRSALDKMREGLEEMMPQTEFDNFLSSQVLPQLEEQVGTDHVSEVLRTITKVLHIQCELLCLKQYEDRDLVITNTSWLTNRVFECVLSPHNFPGCRLDFPKSGVVPILTVKEALRHVHKNVNAVFDLLVTYRICLECGYDRSLALFPSKVPGVMLDTFLRQIANSIIKVGRVLVATVDRVPPSPVLLHTIALDVLEYYAIPISNISDDACLWKDGLIFRREDVLVRLQREYPDGAIALTVAGKEHSDAECLEVTERVQEIGSVAAKRVSDGSHTVWKVLSSTELNDQAQEEAKTHKRRPLTIRYSMKEVQAVMTGSSSGTITRRGITDDVRKLLVVPKDHILAISRKIWRRLALRLKRDDGEDAWRRLGGELRISDDDLDDLELDNESATPGLAFAMIWFWSHHLSSTVRALQDALLCMERPTLAELLGPLPDSNATPSPGVRSSDDQLSLKVLGRIVGGFAQKDHCISLAHELSLGRDFTDCEVESSRHTVRHIAFGIFIKWLQSHSDRANSDILSEALRNIGRADLVDRLQSQSAHLDGPRTAGNYQVTSGWDEQRSATVVFPKMLDDVSNRLASLDEVITLAAELDMTTDHIARIHSTNLLVHSLVDVARNALRRWKNMSKQPYVDVLYKALVIIGRADVAKSLID